MSDGIVPALDFGDATADRATAFAITPANGLPSGPPGRRTLDLRRTETPGLGDMPKARKKQGHRRRYAVVLLDFDGRLTDQRLFSQLGVPRPQRPGGRFG